MKRYAIRLLAVAIIVCLFVSMFTVGASAIELKTGIGLVESNGLRLRAKPNTDAEILATAAKGDQTVAAVDAVFGQKVQNRKVCFCVFTAFTGRKNIRNDRKTGTFQTFLRNFAIHRPNVGIADDGSSTNLGYCCGLCTETGQQGGADLHFVCF